MNERIAERIRMLRLQKGLSQQNIADELNLTVAAYSNIERGITAINLERLYQLSEIFNLSISSTVASFGRLIVFEIAPDKNG